MRPVRVATPYMDILGVLNEHKRKGVPFDYLVHRIGIGRGEIEGYVQTLVDQGAVCRQGDVIILKRAN